MFAKEEPLKTSLQMFIRSYSFGKNFSNTWVTNLKVSTILQFHNSNIRVSRLLALLFWKHCFFTLNWDFPNRTSIIRMLKSSFFEEIKFTSIWTFAQNVLFHDVLWWYFLGFKFEPKLRFPEKCRPFCICSLVIQFNCIIKNSVFRNLNINGKVWTKICL